MDTLAAQTYMKAGGVIFVAKEGRHNEKDFSDTPAIAPILSMLHKKRVLVVDRQPVFRYGLIHLLNGQSDLMGCGEAADCASAIAATEQLQPDILTTDLMLRNSNGLDLIQSVRASFPKLPIIVISSFEEHLYGEHALRAGARGFVMKDEVPDEIISAIRRVLSGRIYLSSLMGTKLLAPITNGTIDLSNSPVERLSGREMEVFALLGQAFETKQIAELLNVSVKTIETYREHLKVKLNVENSTQLLRRAVEWAYRNEPHDSDAAKARRTTPTPRTVERSSGRTMKR